MSEMEMKERLEKLSHEIDPMPSEQKSFILGFMEGVAQMSDRNRNKEEE